MFGLGKPNDAYARYFIGKSYLKPLTDPKETVFMANVTFEPGCRNNWHIHHSDKGGRTDTSLHIRTWMVSGVGKGSSRASSG